MLRRIAYLWLAAGASLGVSAAGPVARVDLALLDGLDPLAAESAETRPAGTDLLLLQFWASWCHSCGALMWDLDEILSRRVGVGYLAISIDDDEAAARGYIERHGLFAKYRDRYFMDTDRKLSASLDISAVPVVMLVDSQGNVLASAFGHLNSTDLRNFANAMSNAPIAANKGE